MEFRDQEEESKQKCWPATLWAFGFNLINLSLCQMKIKDQRYHPRTSIVHMAKHVARSELVRIILYKRKCVAHHESDTCIVKLSISYMYYGTMYQCIYLYTIEVHEIRNTNDIVVKVDTHRPFLHFFSSCGSLLLSLWGFYNGLSILSSSIVRCYFMVVMFFAWRAGTMIEWIQCQSRQLDIPQRKPHATDMQMM